MKKDWKFKMVFSCIFGVGIIVLSLAAVTYMNFIQKSIDYNEKIVQLTFKAGEENIRNMMEESEKSLNRFAKNSLAYKFYLNDFKSKKEHTANTKAIVEAFDEVLAINPNMYGMALVSGNGRTVVSTTKGRTQGTTEISETFYSLMEECGENYPYTEWFYYEYAEIGKNQPLEKLVQKPVLLGMRALGESEDAKGDVYLLTALDEEALAKCYEAAAIYEEGNALLLDEENHIVSSTNKEDLGSSFVERKDIWSVSYPLRYQEWTLVSQAPTTIYFADAMGILKFGLLLTVAALCGGGLILAFLLRRYTRPIQQLMERMKMVGEEQFDFPEPKPAGLAELDALNVQFYDTVQKLKLYIEEIKKVENEKKKEELKVLQYQINPHFLANSLNSIRWMAILSDQTKVADSLAVLSRVFIPMLRNPGLTWTLKDELTFIQNYVEMMKIRYGDIIEYHLECGEDLYMEEFPRFILQPIIENCFVHRFDSPGIEHIYLTVEKEEGFTVTVRNTGGFIEPERLQEINEKILGENSSQEELDTKSIGLRNIKKRLYYLYGEKGNIHMISNEEVGVLIKISF